MKGSHRIYRGLLEDIGLQECVEPRSNKQLRERAVDIFNLQTLVAKLVPDGVVGTYEYSHAGKNIDRNNQFITIMVPRSTPNVEFY